MRRKVESLIAVQCLLMLVTRPAFADLFAIHWDSGDFYSVSTTDASPSLIGNTGQTLMASLELAPDGTLYAFTAGSSTLYTINPNDASSTAIGPLGIGSVFEGGLAFAPDGSAYGTNQDSSSNPVLFSVNLSTGAATTIGTISGGSHDINGLAWRSDGKLVGIDRVTNSLLTIDPVTAASSVITALSPTIGAVGGMAAIGDAGHFAAGGSNELWTVDLFTGSHSLVGSFAPTITGTGISGLAVPEPATLTLLALSGLAALRRRRR